MENKLFHRREVVYLWWRKKMDTINTIEDTEYLIALSNVLNIGPVSVRNLTQKFESAKNVFQQNLKELKHTGGLSQAAAEIILSKETFKVAEDEIKYCLKNDIQLIPYTSYKYPKRLKSHTDSPVVLFFKGQGDLNAARQIGIVGTRTPSAWGSKICEEIVDQLKDYEVTIYSGLAHGIDIAAHNQSLLAGLSTIGVVGHGLDMVYPYNHKQIASKMTEQGGLLSSFLHGEVPDRKNFPKRNKVLAGLIDALIVVETKIKGGSILTAEYAHEYDRTIYAVPGRLGDPLSAGCNRLIKDGKARIFDHAEDVARLFEWDNRTTSDYRSIQTSLLPSLSPLEQRVLNTLKIEEALKFDRISYETTIKSSKLTGVLLDLEFKKLIKSLPGSQYVIMPGISYMKVAEPRAIYHK